MKPKANLVCSKIMKGGIIMKVYTAEIWWNWTNGLALCGVFSTEKKAQEAIEFYLKKNKKQQPEKPITQIKEIEMDHFE